jgi:hypothetical protein
MRNCHGPLFDLPDQIEMPNVILGHHAWPTGHIAEFRFPAKSDQLAKFFDHDFSDFVGVGARIHLGALGNQPAALVNNHGPAREERAVAAQRVRKEPLVRLRRLAELLREVEVERDGSRDLLARGLGAKED